MVSGGRPLWYLQLFTTGAAFVLTIFFASVCLSWSSGLAEIAKPPKYPQDEWDHFIKEGIRPYKDAISSALVWVNLACGLSVVCGGGAFGYLLYRRKVTLLYTKIWFGLVAVFTLVWMISSVVFYVKTEEVAGGVLSDHKQSITSPLSSVYSWGKKRSGATVIGLVVFPTCLYLFLTFVAYRLHVKIEIYGNENPENVNRDFAPGTWVERKAAAEGGTWEREEAVPLVVEGKEGVTKLDPTGNVTGADPTGAPQVVVAISTGENDEQQVVVQSLEEVQQAVLVEDAKTDNMTGGLGSWLEDVFDYTF